MAGGSGVQNQPLLHREFNISLGYTVKPFFKNKMNKRKRVKKQRDGGKGKMGVGERKGRRGGREREIDLSRCQQE